MRTTCTGIREGRSGIDTGTRYMETVNEGRVGTWNIIDNGAVAEERVGTCSRTQSRHNAGNKYQHHRLNVQMTNGEGEYTSYDQVRSKKIVR